MFKKNFHSKSCNLLKTSVWKSLKSQWIQVAPCLEPLLTSLSQVQAEKLQFNEQKEHSSLYWQLEPEKKLIAIQVPFSSHLIPSLTLCWEYPTCVPIIVIEQQVEKFIYKGADLMAPGVIGDIPDVSLETIVGIAPDMNPNLIIGLGILKMTASEFTATRKGKVVQMIHFFSDKLWEKCGRLPLPTLSNTSSSSSSSSSLPTSSSSVKESTSTSISSSSSLPPTPVSGTSTPTPTQVNTETLPPSSSTTTLLEPTTTSHGSSSNDSTSHDTIALESFLLSLYALPEFPITASTLLSKYMLTLHRELDFRFTKWKKMSKFLKAMEKEHLIQLKERGQEVYIQSVNLSHSYYDQVILPSNKKKVFANASTKESPTSPNSTALNLNASLFMNSTFLHGHSQTASNEHNNDSKKTTFHILDYYQATSSTLFLFPKSSALETKLSLTELKSRFHQWVKPYLDPKSRKFIQSLPESFPSSLLPSSPPPPPSSSSSSSRSSLNAPMISKDTLFDSILASMPKWHGFSTNPTHLIPGSFHPIEISVKRIRGTKHLTLIYQPKSLPLFDQRQLISHLQVRCASSVTLVDSERVQIQGDQVKVLKKWVHEIGVDELVKFL